MDCNVLKKTDLFSRSKSISRCLDNVYVSENIFFIFHTVARSSADAGEFKGVFLLHNVYIVSPDYVNKFC